MALTAYKHKRSLKGTPEPSGGKSAGDSLRFVVQKHKASRLHYDFRLEMGGVLKSWAVPKGPSLDPSDKRLAMHVEDHPYDYKDFEGIIPKGNYGAGTVIVWDEGYYVPIQPAKGKAAQAKALLKQLKSGSLKIVLHGKKLKGEFALVRMKGKEDSAWLLIKHKDQYATTDDITLKDKSVKSGKTLEKVAAISTHKRGKQAEGDGGASNQKSAGKKQAPRRAVKKKLEAQIDPKMTNAPQEPVNTAAILRKAKRAPFPTSLSPMLATLAAEPFDDADWVYEVKWDGYRAIALLDGNQVKLLSRNGHAYNDKFFPVASAAKEWGIHAVVDGEIVAVDGDGIANFGKLQNWRGESDGGLLFYAFDLLWYKGKDLTGLPLRDRKAVLASLIPGTGIIRSGFSVDARGTEFFGAAAALGLEGIIAKRADSRYHAGNRSADWLKIKVRNRQEVVIAGYTEIEGTPKPFSSLLLGIYERGKLRYAGKVGTGFKESQQRDMLALFKPLVRKTSPFVAIPDYNKPSRFKPVPASVQVTWLKPVLVCEVYFSEVTADGVFRHPTFVGMRDDKDAAGVVSEYVSPARGGAKPLFLSSANEQVRKLGGVELSFTNLDKVYWPDEGYTKGDMLEYYHQVAKYILPYLKGRPQSLNRFPDGVKGQSFYQKDVTGKVPDWVELYPYKAEGDNRKKHYMLCNNEAALLYMANLGTIEMNPWSSTITNPDHPDWCILDLDPDKGNTFEQVIAVARAIHELLEDIGVASFCKTSGSTGLHIYIPLGSKYTYAQSQLFAKWVAARTDDEFDFTSIERATAKRRGKVYIDYLQNRPAATLAAPYSLRPKSGATVSMPLRWDEVTKGLQTADFTIDNALERIKSEGDLFKPVLRKGVNLKKILDRR